MGSALSKPGDPSFLQPTKPDATPGVVVYTFNPSGHGKQANLCESEASLVRGGSFRPVRVTQRDPI